MITTKRSGRARRARRHLLVAGLVLAYLAAGGMVLTLGGRVAGGLAGPHLVLLGRPRQKATGRPSREEGVG